MLGTFTQGMQAHSQGGRLLTSLTGAAQASETRTSSGWTSAETETTLPPSLFMSTSAQNSGPSGGAAAESASRSHTFHTSLPTKAMHPADGMGAQNCVRLPDAPPAVGLFVSVLVLNSRATDDSTSDDVFVRDTTLNTVPGCVTPS